MKSSHIPQAERMNDAVEDAHQTRFRILVVCTGNLFRSPLAAGLLQQGFDEVAPNRFVVDSAGSAGASGARVTDEVAALAEHWGFSLREFRAKRMLPSDIIGADLIIGMARQHRSQVVTLEPRALRRSFTLREFARIIRPFAAEDQSSPGRRWELLVARAQRARMPAPNGPDFDDVIDPHGDWDALSPMMIGQMLPSIHEMVDWEYRSVLRRRM